MNLKEKSNSQLRNMLMKDSGYSASEVVAVITEMKSRGLPTPDARMVTGGRDKVPMDKPKMPTKLPKSKPKKTAMMRGGMANGKQHMYAAGGMVNDGLKALKKASPEAYNKITGK
tara:strand:- start:1544 stop:1888 length:345 start_codon:yes stop_codon:yes gene_type:complete